MVLTVELIKSYINLKAHPLSMNIYKITERPKGLISRPILNLLLVSPALHYPAPQMPSWIKPSHNNHLVQDHLQKQLGNLIPYAAVTHSVQACPSSSCGTIHGAEGFVSTSVMNVMTEHTFTSALTGSLTPVGCIVSPDCFPYPLNPHKDVWITALILVINGRVLLFRPALQQLPEALPSWVFVCMRV